LGAGLPPYGAVPSLGALGGSRSTALALAFAATASYTTPEASWVPLRIGKTKFPWKPRRGHRGEAGLAWTRASTLQQ